MPTGFLCGTPRATAKVDCPPFAGRLGSAAKLSGEVLQRRLPAQLDWGAGWSLKREVFEGAVVIGGAG